MSAKPPAITKPLNHEVVVEVEPGVFAGFRLCADGLHIRSWDSVKHIVHAKHHVSFQALLSQAEGQITFL